MTTAKAKLGRFSATGTNPRSARKKLDVFLRRAISGNYTPRTIYVDLGDAGEYFGLAWRTPEDWRFSVIDFSETGPLTLRWTVAESGEEAFRRVCSSIARLAYTICPKTGKDNWDQLVRRLLDDEQEATYFASWVAAQRAQAAYLRDHPRANEAAAQAWAAANVASYLPKIPAFT